jgi:cupin superfamily acireductone dioxygenase involved in methionine salvage
LFRTKIKKYITSYVYGGLEVVYTDEETGKEARNMQRNINTHTHITQAVLWCIQGRIFKEFFSRKATSSNSNTIIREWKHYLNSISILVRRLKFRARFTQLDFDLKVGIPLVHNTGMSDISVR